MEGGGRGREEEGRKGGREGEEREEMKKKKKKKKRTQVILSLFLHEFLESFSFVTDFHEFRTPSSSIKSAFQTGDNQIKIIVEEEEEEEEEGKQTELIQTKQKV